MNVVVDLTLAALRPFCSSRLDSYERVLESAFSSHPPAFGMGWYGEKYRQFALDPLWLATSLIDNSLKEGEGATKLWKLSGNTGEPAIADKVRLHAIDEARHARLYLGMLKLSFPGAADPSLLESLHAQAPPYGPKDYPRQASGIPDFQVLDQIIQMNIGEIRTRIHQLLLMPVITAHSQPAVREKLDSVLKSILADETKHISYTAELIERAANQNFQWVRDTMHLRLSQFDQITREEVGESTFSEEDLV